MNENLSQKIIMESLAMDLKRVAIGLHRGSLGMAEKFKQEAFMRATELEILNENEYIKKLLLLMKNVIKDKNDRVPEDALMFSTLFQNFALKNF